MFLDWLLKTEEDKISYDELKMLAQDRSSEDGNLPYGQNTRAAAAAVAEPHKAHMRTVSKTHTNQLKKVTKHTNLDVTRS